MSMSGDYVKVEFAGGREDQSSASKLPLSDVRVLDLGRVLASPWGTQILADFGADVIKVERPGLGDETRQWGPPFYQDANGNKVSTYYCSANRGKRSIALDFESQADRDQIMRLAKDADVLVENFRVGSLAKWGLDYESIQKINPRIVYCSITGFGQSGPYAAKAGYDSVIQGLGGMMSLTGEPDHKPGGGPQKTAVAVIDLMTGVYAVSGIMIALHERQRTGLGQYVDVSLLDVQISSLSTFAASYLRSGEVPVRKGNEHPTVLPGGAMCCSDGHVMLMVGNDPQFHRLCRRLGLEHLVDDPRFSSNERRVEHRDILMPMLQAAFATKSRSHWIETLSGDGVPCEPINDIAEALSDPHVRERNLVVNLPTPEFGEISVVGNPIRLSRTPAQFKSPPMYVGSDPTGRFHEKD
jgi:crotonobetainyl-CoA:carnitine CoA-transferase CaiB-like acyl-CoA transferase